MTKRMTSRDVDCPTCGAPKAERCRGSAYSGRGGRTVDYHIDRRAAARAANVVPLPSPRDLAAELVDRGDGWHVSPELLEKGGS